MKPLCKYLAFFGFMLLASPTFGQEDSEDVETGDPNYREDQFYFGVGYNLATNMPAGFDIRGFSGGLSLGFLRDMPVNQKRNVAIAIGAGLTYDQYGQNLAIDKALDGNTTFTILDAGTDFNSNRISVAGIEAPFELRWRSSTPSSYKFWRVYAGFRVAYIYYFKARLKQSGNDVSITSLPELNRIQMGLSMGLGYNTVSVYTYYGLSPLFDNAQTTAGEQVAFKTIKLGLIFYIL